MTSVWKRVRLTTALLALALAVAACGSGAAGVPPAEQEAIEAAVEDFYVRSADAPAYQATVEEVEGDWARVSLAPEGVENVGGTDIVFVRRDATGSIEATPDPVAQAGREHLDDAQVGWVIVAGPQAQFTDAELDAAGVPESLRP